ncbi:putative WD repeat-containing protein [Cladophialophora carrionii]|uniref:Putative WD repeat-containing protein n=1 Tax=Cladophialophora carrionii TaxID=86049 RepID=A0A1C1CS24_9EURO|nr:putative WD repeat-containing protein [Cladophialophora carrionii]
MVKSYLKFEHSKTFGQICTTAANVVWDPTSDHEDLTTGRGGAGCAYVGANEDVLVWDLKKSEKIREWHVEDNSALVTVIHRSLVDLDIFAVGYDDGKIRIWDARTATVIITFNGHRTAISQLTFDQSGVRLASGSKDTDIIVWDLVAEVGLYRLRGHKDQITSLNFLSPEDAQDGTDDTSTSQGFLLSTSKDALIKVWDLSTQHCVETHVTQTNGECWALGLAKDRTGCITAGNDGELKVWSINQSVLQEKLGTSIQEGHSILRERGALYRHGRDRPIAVTFHPRRDLIAVHGAEKAVELLRIRSETEVRKSLARKRKRRKEKEGPADTDSGVDVADDTEEAADISKATGADVFVPYVIVRTGGKVRSIDWAGGKSGKSVQILVATSNNQLELFDVSASEKRKKSSETPEYNRTLSVDMPGHRTDVRCVAISSDDRMLATASQGSLKIWNTKTQTCLRTLDCGHALSLTFLPGDKIVVVGTREGTLEVFDIAASILLDTIDAHERDIWSLQVSPDGKSLVTGSADKSAKFWQFKVIQEEVLGTTRKTSKLSLVHTRTLKVADDILSVCFSPDERLLAVSTLDSTVKVFFVDTLKLFLTLYGHKLPVLSMDVSYDSKLIVTSSADKNVRVWGLDFGDCHKAFFAHNDSILAVKFVPTNNEGNGHHFFSASKDRVIKYYDADKFEQIQKLDGHKGEIWAMAVAHSGEFLVTASHDKSIRLWNQTDEQIFLEEEREKELEDLYESTLLTSLENEANELADPNGNAAEAGPAGKQTAQTLMAGEKIAEALELGLEDLRTMQAYDAARKGGQKAAVPQRNPVLLAHNNVSASSYVLSVFQKIPAASLQDALLVLSFSQIPALFTFLALWAQEERATPLTCRILLFMLKTHQRQIVSSRQMKGMLEDVRAKLRRTLTRQKSEMGFNLAGLRVLGRRVREAAGESEFVDEETWGDAQNAAGQKGQKGRKREFVNIA